MNNEIKEILKCIKDKKRDYVGTNGCLYQDLDRKELDLLLDYITNLQEENEKSFEKGYAKGIIVAELDNENEFIVAYKELKQRIDKAIEYIKLGKTFENEEIRRTIERIQNDLLNILNGDDKYE